VLVAAVLAVGCGHNGKAKPDKTVEVVVTTPTTGNVLDYQDFTGRVDAFRTVDLRARVTGYVNEAPFKEGDVVKKGQILFRIDPRSYRADLAQAQANLKLAVADRDLQEMNALRARRMLGTRSIGKEEYDQILASREKSHANVGALEAARDRAALYLEYADVVAPHSGRISRRYIDPGNLVKADDTMLTTLVLDDPVYVYFDVDERTYLDLAGEKLSSSSATRIHERQFPVLMRLANEEEFIHPGKVDFVDNRLNGNTGTIRMRGVFTNALGTLKSGLFARIRLPIGKPYQSLLIPDEALQSDQGRKFVYVVDAEDKVRYRSVTLGQAIPTVREAKNGAKKTEQSGQEPEKMMLRVIKKGLKQGDRVIISGMQRVRPDLHVKVRVEKPARAPEVALLKLLNQGPDDAAGAEPRSKQ
jgi:RND family efflux transporter MFP subunit